MIIGGKEINIRVESIPTTNLEPDLDQPRRYALALELDSKGLDPNVVKKPEGIEQSAKFTELVRAIVENEGI